MPRRRAPRSAVALAALAACARTADAPGVPDAPGAPPADPIALTAAPDLDPRPDVVEVALEAKLAEVEIVPGHPTEAWTFGGTVPGPLIRATRGDRIVVRFTNALPAATTVHWHGVRVPAAMDGVPHHSQHEVAPGGTFTYDFVARDAGLFWYHPHVTSAAQVGYGLYGAILVEDPAEPSPGGEPRVLVLSDIDLDAEGRLGSPASGGDLGTLFGREGAYVLVNGRVAPRIAARAGQRQRWRVVNAAKSRYFQLALAGHRFTVYGGDGGLAEAPEEVAMPVLAPGERLDLGVVLEGAPGDVLELRSIPFDRGYGSTEFRSPEKLMSIQLGEREAEREAAPEQAPEVRREIPPLDLSRATPVAVRLTQATVGGKLVLGINGLPFEEAPPIPARIGETQVWTVTNEMAWAHPFHLHGFFFQLLDRPGPRAWKDTAQVPIKGTLRFAVRYDERPGAWMFHCHVLDHADAGMMGRVELTE